MKTEVVDYSNAAPTPPWISRLYDGWKLVEPQPQRRSFNESEGG